jgi:hypothetical protein
MRKKKLNALIVQLRKVEHGSKVLFLLGLGLLRCDLLYFFTAYDWSGSWCWRWAGAGNES